VSLIIQPETFLAMEGEYRPLFDDGVHFFYKNDFKGQYGDVQVTILAPRPSLDEYHESACAIVVCGSPYIPPPPPPGLLTAPEPATLPFMCACFVLAIFRRRLAALRP
jgi:hypothetical protein